MPSCKESVHNVMCIFFCNDLNYRIMSNWTFALMCRSLFIFQKRYNFHCFTYKKTFAHIEKRITEASINL